MNMSNTSDYLLGNVIRDKDRIWSYIFSITRDYHLSEDVLQEVCLFLVNAADKYDPSRPFLPWALGIARNKSYEAIRACEKQASLLNDDVLKKLQDSLIIMSRDENVRLEALQRCMNEISEENRKIMTMKYVDKFSADKIAGLINRSRTATFSLLQRLRASLAGCVGNKVKEGNL